MSSEKFTPPDGYPGPQELKHRLVEAQGILKGRGIGVSPNVDLMNERAFRRMVTARLGCTTEELAYFFELISVEGIEAVVEETTPKNVIHLPGGRLA